MDRSAKVEALVNLPIVTEKMRRLFDMLLAESQQLRRTLRELVTEENEKRPRREPPSPPPPPPPPPPPAPPAPPPPPRPPPPWSKRRLVFSSIDWALGTTIDTELESTSATVSMFDPLTWKLIECPVRFEQCRHAQCVDINTVPLLPRSSTGSLQCPICNIVVAATDTTLMISRWFKTITEQAAGHKFAEYDTRTGKFIRCYTNTKKRKIDASIDLDDDAPTSQTGGPGGSDDKPIVL